MVNDNPVKSDSKKQLYAYAFIGHTFLERQKERARIMAEVRENIGKMDDGEFEQLCRMCPEQEEMLKEMRAIKNRK